MDRLINSIPWLGCNPFESLFISEVDFSKRMKDNGKLYLFLNNETNDCCSIRLVKDMLVFFILIFQMQKYDQ